MTSLSNQLELVFKARGYKWQVSGELISPTVEDIDRVLDHIKETLVEQEGKDVQLETGRLLVKKNDGHLDLYVYWGEL
jgi:hypothetical protein